MSWRSELSELLPALGHRNWILVADAAYPQQCSPGIRTLVTEESMGFVLEHLVHILHKAEHVRPVACIDAEFAALTDSDVPGAVALRERNLQVLGGIEIVPMHHAELLEQLDEVSKRYTVAVLKTTSSVPYSSVFFRLECGYWNDDQEAALRAHLARRTLE